MQTLEERGNTFKHRTAEDKLSSMVLNFLEFSMMYFGEAAIRAVQ